MTDTITIHKAVAERASTALDYRIHLTKLRLEEYGGSQAGITTILQEALANDETALGALNAAIEKPKKTLTLDQRVALMRSSLEVNSNWPAGICHAVALRLATKLQEAEVAN